MTRNRGAIRRVTLPSPPAEYDAQDQRETRRALEQVLSELSAVSLRAPDPITVDHGALSADATLTLTDGDDHLVTLGANLTLALATPIRVDRTTVRVFVTQDATGSRLVTWVGVTWLVSVPPTLSTAPGAIDLLEFVYDKTNTTWRGWMIGRNMTLQALLLKGPLTTNGQVGFPATPNPSADAHTIDDFARLQSFTPIDASGAGLTFTNALGLYFKIADLVIAHLRVTYPATANGAAAKIGGLPFAVNASFSMAGGGMIGYSAVTSLSRVSPDPGATTFGLYTADGVGVLNSALSASDNYLCVIYQT